MLLAVFYRCYWVVHYCGFNAFRFVCCMIVCWENVHTVAVGWQTVSNDWPKNKKKTIMRTHQTKLRTIFHKFSKMNLIFCNLLVCFASYNGHKLAATMTAATATSTATQQHQFDWTTGGWERNVCKKKKRKEKQKGETEKQHNTRSVENFCELQAPNKRSTIRETVYTID